MLNKLGKIFLNGNLIGAHNNIPYLLRVLKLFRRNSLINIFTSLNWDTRFNELFISTDGGRCCRPLLIVENNNLVLTKQRVQQLNNKIINWNNLVGGFMDEKDNEIITIVIIIVKSKKNLLENLEKHKPYLNIDAMNLITFLLPLIQKN